MHTTIVYGRAGCGKTTELVRRLEEVIQNEGTWIVLAPTNSAVENIRQKAGSGKDPLKFKTIHSYFRINFETNVMTGPLIVFEHVFIDEFSLIDRYLFKKCQQLLAKSGVCRELVIFGDPLQLPPVTTNKIYVSTHRIKKLNKLMPGPDMVINICPEVLEHVTSGIFGRRFLNPVNYVQLTTNYRSNSHVREIINSVMNDRTDGVKYVEFDDIPKLIVDGYTYIASRYSILQKAYDAIFKGRSGVVEIPQIVPGNIGYKRLYLYVGMRVFTTITDHNLGIINGEVSEIAEIGEKLKLRRSNGDILELPRIDDQVKSYYPVSPEWLMTVHKAQGKTIKKVIVCIDKTFGVSMIYTAMTRASEELLFYTSTADKNKTLKESTKSREFKQLNKLINEIAKSTDEVN